MVEELLKILVLVATDLEGCQTCHHLAELWVMHLQRESPKLVIRSHPQKVKLSAGHRQIRTTVQLVELLQKDLRVIELLLLSRRKVIDPKVKLQIIQKLGFELQ